MFKDEYNCDYFLGQIISPIITEAITIHERHSEEFLTGNTAQRKTIMLHIRYRICNYLYDEKLLNSVCKIISFFSDCYDIYYQGINTSKISYNILYIDMFKGAKTFTTYNIIYLWLFFSLKDIFGIDDRVINISDHDNKCVQSFQDIVEHLYTSLLQLHGALVPNIISYLQEQRVSFSQT